MTDEMWHLAGPAITYDNVQRQRCVWCGALILEHPLERMARPLDPDEDPDNPEPWQPATFKGWVAISGSNPRITRAEQEPPDGRAPDRSCMRLLPSEIGTT